MWDPATHPDMTLDTLKESNATVVVSKEQTFPAWLVAKGLINESQIDTSYDGNPARFVGDPSIVQQGYATSEPYTYEHDTPAWNKKVGYGLLSSVGFDPHAANVSVRADKLAELSPCLTKLVPIIQQANADFMSSPAGTDQKIVDIVAADGSYSPYTIGEATYSSDTLRSQKLIENENGSVSTYDPARVAAFVKDIAPVIATQGQKVDPAVDPASLFDPQFGNTSIAIP